MSTFKGKLELLLEPIVFMLHAFFFPEYQVSSWESMFLSIDQTEYNIRYTMRLKAPFIRLNC